MSMGKIKHVAARKVVPRKTEGTSRRNILSLVGGMARVRLLESTGQMGSFCQNCPDNTLKSCVIVQQSYHSSFDATAGIVAGSQIANDCFSIEAVRPHLSSFDDRAQMIGAFHRWPSPTARRPMTATTQPNFPRTCTLQLRSLANTNCCSRRHNRISALVGVANYQPTCSLREVKDDFSALLGAVVNEAVKFDR